MDNVCTQLLWRPMKCEAVDTQEPGGRVRVTGGDCGVAAARPAGTVAPRVGRRDATASLAARWSVQRAMHLEHGRGGWLVAREGLE